MKHGGDSNHVVSFAVIFLAILVVRLLVALMPGLFSSVLPIHVVIQVLKGVAIVYVILVMRDSITGILEATLMRLPVSPRSVAVARLVPSFIFIFLMTLLAWMASFILPGDGVSSELDKLMRRSDLMVLVLFWLPIISDLVSMGLSMESRMLRRILPKAAFLSGLIPLGLGHFVVDFDVTLAVTLLAFAGLSVVTLEHRSSYLRFAHAP